MKASVLLCKYFFLQIKLLPLLTQILLTQLSSVTWYEDTLVDNKITSKGYKNFKRVPEHLNNEVLQSVKC
jgi:hypothetical protein